MLTNENDCLSLLKLLSTYYLIPYNEWNRLYNKRKRRTKITKENERSTVHSDSMGFRLQAMGMNYTYIYDAREGIIRWLLPLNRESKIESLNWNFYFFHFCYGLEWNWLDLVRKIGFYGCCIFELKALYILFQVPKLIGNVCLSKRFCLVLFFIRLVWIEF